VEVKEDDSQNGHEDLGFTFLPIGEFLREFHRQERGRKGLELAPGEI
jgi:hypothetical protein